MRVHLKLENLVLHTWIILFVAINLIGCSITTWTVVTVNPLPFPPASLTEAITNTKVLEPIKIGQMPAFPGAEGFGSNTVGGRGGTVIEVTNLNDAGSGSLRAAIDAVGPRIVVFRIAGIIELQTSLIVNKPYITIAGQTAPGGGVTLRGVKAQTDPLMDIQTHDVVVRYLTFRAGPPAAGDAMNISVSSHTWDHNVYNIVVDHNSMSWGVDQVFATWYDVHDISIQRNIFSEGLDCSIHAKGCHSKGPMLGSYSSDESNNQLGARNISFHHNLMAHNGERDPLVKTSGICDVVNNVVYNPYWSFSLVDMEQQLTMLPVNYVGNYFKPGPDTLPEQYGVQAVNPGSYGAEIFVQGNIGPHRLDDSLPEINIVRPDSRKFVVLVQHPASYITTTSAIIAYTDVLKNAGANLGLGCDGKFFSRRDAIDARIVNEIMQGTGRIIDNPSEVGGYLTPVSGSPCSDADHDGMSDIWEKIKILNPQNPLDGAIDTDGDGYTNVEEFLNGTNPLQ